jgi:hypothetical protein
MGSEKIRETAKKSEAISWISRAKDDVIWVIGRKCRRRRKAFVKRQSSNVLALTALGSCSSQDFCWKEDDVNQGISSSSPSPDVSWMEKETATQYSRVSGWFENTNMCENPCLFSRSLTITKRDYGPLDCRAIYSFSQGHLPTSHTQIKPFNKMVPISVIRILRSLENPFKVEPMEKNDTGRRRPLFHLT